MWSSCSIARTWSDVIGVSSCSFQGATMAHSLVQILARKSSASLTVTFTLSPRQCVEKRVSCNGYTFFSERNKCRNDEWWIKYVYGAVFFQIECWSGWISFRCLYGVWIFELCTEMFPPRSLQAKVHAVRSICQKAIEQKNKRMAFSAPVGAENNY